MASFNNVNFLNGRDVTSELCCYTRKWNISDTLTLYHFENNEEVNPFEKSCKGYITFKKFGNNETRELGRYRKKNKKLFSFTRNLVIKI